MSKISLIIVDVTGNKEQQAMIPDDAPIGRVIAKLVPMMNLPATGPDGQLISYKFIHKATGRQLHEDQTLAEASIQDGDLLRLQPEITAG
ncbi:MAG: EsaB/YukD family protein [Chitinophagales bacterium]